MNDTLLAFTSLDKFSMVRDPVKLDTEAYRSFPHMFSKLFAQYLQRNHPEQFATLSVGMNVLTVHDVNGDAQLYVTYRNLWPENQPYITKWLSLEEITVSMLIALATCNSKMAITRIMGRLTKVTRNYVRGIICDGVPLSTPAPHPCWRNDKSTNIIHNMVELYMHRVGPNWNVDIQQALVRLELDHYLYPSQALTEVWLHVSSLVVQTPNAYENIAKAMGLDKLVEKSGYIQTGWAERVNHTQDIGPAVEAPTTITHTSSPEMITLEAVTMPMEVWLKAAPGIIKAKLDVGAPLNKQETKYLSTMLNERCITTAIKEHFDKQ